MNLTKYYKHQKQFPFTFIKSTKKNEQGLTMKEIKCPRCYSTRFIVKLENSQVFLECSGCLFTYKLVGDHIKDYFAK